MIDELNGSKVDDSQEWAVQINHVMNSRWREAGRSPYQFLFGVEPRSPTSVLTSPDTAAAHSSAALGDQAREAEAMRRAAAIGFAEQIPPAVCEKLYCTRRGR